MRKSNSVRPASDQVQPKKAKLQHRHKAYDLHKYDGSDPDLLEAIPG
jgi:hypothetical protein